MHKNLLNGLGFFLNKMKILLDSMLYGKAQLAPKNWECKFQLRLYPCDKCNYQCVEVVNVMKMAGKQKKKKKKKR